MLFIFLFIRLICCDEKIKDSDIKSTIYLKSNIISGLFFWNQLLPDDENQLKNLTSSIENIDIINRDYLVRGKIISISNKISIVTMDNQENENFIIIKGKIYSIKYEKLQYITLKDIIKQETSVSELAKTNK